MASQGKTPVVLDFSGIKAGGGVQLALNFLEEVAASPPPDMELFHVFPRQGALAQHAQSIAGPRRLSCPTSPIRRVLFEHSTLQDWIRKNGIRAIFTFFGAGIPHPPAVVSIVSVAYPILCYPESPYWQHIGARQRLAKSLLNRARVRRLKSATRIVVETQVMRRRLSRVLGRAESEIVVGAPAVSGFLEPVGPRPGGTLDVLCLSGMAPHKNLWRLPRIAEELARMLPGSLPGIRFHLTVGKEAWRADLDPADRAVADALEGLFVFHGSVHPRDIGNLYAKADVLLSLSDLESFSNNYMEAWRARVPLVASDRDFAREICGDSAAYAEPHDPAGVARAIAELHGDPARRQRMLEAGDRLLALLPSRTEKMRQIFDVIRGSLAVPGGRP